MPPCHLRSDFGLVGAGTSEHDGGNKHARAARWLSLKQVNSAWCHTLFVDKLSITGLFFGWPFLPVFGPFFNPFALPGFRFAGSGARIGLSSSLIATEDVGSNWSG